MNWYRHPIGLFPRRVNYIGKKFGSVGVVDLELRA